MYQFPFLNPCVNWYQRSQESVFAGCVESISTSVTVPVDELHYFQLGSCSNESTVLPSNDLLLSVDSLLVGISRSRPFSFAITNNR